jgi:hypothetical protein
VFGCAAYLQAEISAGRTGVAVNRNRDAGIAQDVLNMLVSGMDRKNKSSFSL